MIKKTYKYKEQTYSDANSVRRAIWKTERKAFGTPQNVDEWASLGVIYTEEEIADPVPTVEEARQRRLIELNRVFADWREDGATIISSLGFEADADERASADVGGLVTFGESAIFMDAENQPHELTLDQLKVLQKEIIQSGISAYETKWAFRNEINSADSVDTLNSIYISFEPKDFTEANNG